MSSDIVKLVASLQSKIESQAQEIKSNTKELRELKHVIQSLVLSLTTNGANKHPVPPSSQHHRQPVKRIVLSSEESDSESEKESEAPAKRKNFAYVSI